MDFNKENSECCSFVIQEEDETVFAFRQDSPVNGYGVTLHNDTLDDKEMIVQEIDTPGSHFIHVRSPKASLWTLRLLPET